MVKFGNAAISDVQIPKKVIYKLVSYKLNWSHNFRMSFGYGSVMVVFPGSTFVFERYLHWTLSIRSSLIWCLSFCECKTNQTWKKTINQSQLERSAIRYESKLVDKRPNTYFQLKLSRFFTKTFECFIMTTTTKKLTFQLLEINSNNNFSILI